MISMKINRLLIFSCFLFLLLLLHGCSGMEAAGKIFEVIKDPKIQIGEPKDQPTMASFSLVGEDILNLNFDGDSTPIQIVVYQLKDDSRFVAADYDSISADGAKALGKNYIDHEEYSVEPSGYKHIKEIELDPKTQFLGVVAHYADIDDVLWKRVTKVNPRGEKVHFLILLKDREVKLDRMDE